MNKLQTHKLRRYLDTLCRTGFDKESNGTKQKLVYTSNAISLLCFLVCTIMSILKYFFVGNFLECVVTMLAGFLLLMFIYFNKMGYSLLGRIAMPLLANLILLTISILFTHDSYLDIYFLFICNTTLQLFDYSERKWAYFSTGFSIICLLFETTALQNFLPDYNLMSAETLPYMNTVLIVGIVIFAIVQARIFVLVRRFKETDLANTQSILMSSQADLKLQNEDLEAFGIAVTHDLKAPISIAHLYLNLINRHVKNRYEADTDLNEFVDTVHISLEQMEKLILAYLSFNKVKNLTIEREVFDLCDEIRYIVKNVLNKSINEDVILTAQQIRINSNRDLLNTVLKNIIENGLKYNKSAHPKVHIDIEEGAHSLLVKIKDNGIGIDSKFQKYLFKPFKRHSTDVEGTGLGLAVAKRAVERLNGTLICRQTSREGTVFEVELFN